MKPFKLYFSILTMIACGWTINAHADPLQDLKAESTDLNSKIQAYQPAACPPTQVCGPVQNPPTSTGKVFDSTSWKFQWKDQELYPIPANYNNPYWFQYLPDGRLELGAAIGDPHTPNSHYPRGQLRELENGKEAAHTVDNIPDLIIKGASCEEIPTATGGTKRSRMVIAQSHGKDNELNRTYCEIKSGDTKASVYFVDDMSGKNGQTETEFPLLDSKGNQLKVAFGEQFDLTLHVGGGIQVVGALDQGVSYLNSEVLSKYWQSEKGLYHCVDAYLGVGAVGSGAGSTGPNGAKGRARFTSITLQAQQ